MMSAQPPSSNLTERFAECILALRYDALPPQAIEMAKQVTLDGLAVILAGATEPSGLGSIVKRYVQEMGGTPDATVITGGGKTSMPNAAFANGTMAHALDFDNTWYPLNHPTSPTLPAILAVAEKQGSPGSAVIEAIATAFEVQARIRLAAVGLVTGEGFHKPGTTGTMGATAGVAKLLGLDRDQLVMALGIAGSRAGSLSINTGTMTKSSHSGHAARMGVECGILAAMGWTASRDVFGKGGFFDVFMADAEPALLLKDFARPLRMVDPGVGFKKHPCNYFTHRPIDAALALRSEHAIDAAQIERVDVRFPRFDYVDRPLPATGLDGKFSVQYTTALALLDGEITVDTFTDARRFAADVIEFLPRVRMIVDETIPFDFEKMHAEVAITLRDGSLLTRRVKELSGFVGFPLTRTQRLDKFYGCARRIIDKGRADRVLALVENLETLLDIREILDLLRDPSPGL
jgi:2-methylcitrate dehydratase PrpD